MTSPQQRPQPQQPPQPNVPDDPQTTIPLPTARTRSLRRYWKHDPADDQAVAQAEEAQTQLLPQRPHRVPTEARTGTPTGTVPMPVQRTQQTPASPAPAPMPAATIRQPAVTPPPTPAAENRSVRSQAYQPDFSQVSEPPSAEPSYDQPPYDQPSEEPVEPGQMVSPGPMPESMPSPSAPMWEHTRGAGLVWTLGAGLALMGARTPVWTLIIGLVILWCVTARGHAVIAEHRRMFDRGGFALRSDKAKMALLTPWYLLQSLPRVLWATLVWLILATAVNLTMTLGTGAPHAQTSLQIFSWTLTLPLLSGSPQSLASLAWGLTTGVWWILTALCGKTTSARSAGFQSAQSSIRHGWDKIRHRGGTLTGIFLIIGTAILLFIGIGGFFTIPTTDWSPLQLTSEVQNEQEPTIGFTSVNQQNQQ